MKLQNPKAALPLLEKVIRIDPKVELAHLDLGILYIDANRQDDALRELMTADKLNPKDVSVHWRLARLYQVMGKKDEAKIEFDETRDLYKTADEPVFDKLHDASGIGTSTK
jgi:Tfp pilus assembly protein PilF